MIHFALIWHTKGIKIGFIKHTDWLYLLRCFISRQLKRCQAHGDSIYSDPEVTHWICVCKSIRLISWFHYTQLTHHCALQILRCYHVHGRRAQNYCKTSSIRPQILKNKYFSSRHAIVFAQFTEAWYEVENKDVFGVAPTGYMRWWASLCN